MTWLPPVVTVEPTADAPVSLTEAKAQCRVDGSDSDTALNIYLATAQAFVEEYTGTKFGDQTIVLRCSRWCDLRRLPIAPVSSVTSITYLDASGNEQTLSTDIYEPVLIGLEPSIRRKFAQIWPSIWPCAEDAIRVTVQAGYTTAPEPMRAAILLLVSQWFDERSSISSVRQSTTADGTIPILPYTVESLLVNYRR